jgi:hypothetical protein
MKYILILSVLLVGCSSDWHIKRAIRKDPTILSKAIVRYHTDTLVTIFDGAKGDTVFLWKDREPDTLIFERPEFRTVVIRDTLWKRIWVETECFPDTIVQTVTVTEYLMQPVIDEMNWWERSMKKVGNYIFVTFLLIVLGFIIYKVLKRV